MKVNFADGLQLTTVRGIGPKTAEKILKLRETWGQHNLETLGLNIPRVTEGMVRGLDFRKNSDLEPFNWSVNETDTESQTEGDTMIDTRQASLREAAEEIIKTLNLPAMRTERALGLGTHEGPTYTYRGPIPVRQEEDTQTSPKQISPAPHQQQGHPMKSQPQEHALMGEGPYKQPQHHPRDDQPPHHSPSSTTAGPQTYKGPPPQAPDYKPGGEAPGYREAKRYDSPKLPPREPETQKDTAGYETPRPHHDYEPEGPVNTNYPANQGHLREGTTPKGSLSTDHPVPPDRYTANMR